MGILEGLFLSFVQAVTEFLPVSSSGHLLLFKDIFKDEIPVFFDIIIHAGSLIAVLIYFRHELKRTLGSALAEIRENKTRKPEVRIVLFLIVSTAVTFAGYLLFKDPIENAFMTPSVLRITYPVTTLILAMTFFVRNRPGVPVSEKSWVFPVIVGLFQAMAILPGISRSGSTIAVMLLMGVKRTESAYYSFLLFIPAVLGALAFSVLEITNLDFIHQNLPALLISFAATAVFSGVFLKLLTWLVKRGQLWLFSVYTFALTVFTWVFLH